MTPPSAPGDVGRLRGLLTGLVLGDALGVRAAPPADEVLRIGVASQLACFTVDAMVRGVMRDVDKGLGTDRALLVWLDDRRWATLQHLPVRRDGIDVAPGDWHNWLARVPAFTERRGNAPAVVAALAARSRPDDGYRSQSLGAHGLVRALPMAIGGACGHDPGYWVDAAARVARLSHAHEVGDLAALATRWLIDSWRCGDPSRGAEEAGLRGDLSVERVGVAAVEAGPPGDITTLQALAPDRSALSALAGGMYVALSCAGPGDVERCLRMAAAAPAAGSSVAAVAGAVLGAAHGVGALPAAQVARLEIAGELDTLAGDLSTALGLAPGRDLAAVYPGI